MIFMSNTKEIDGTFSALPALSLVRDNDIGNGRRKTP
jgi:hypothetical protein